MAPLSTYSLPFSHNVKYTQDRKSAQAALEQENTSVKGRWWTGRLDPHRGASVWSSPASWLSGVHPWGPLLPPPGGGHVCPHLSALPFVQLLSRVRIFATPWTAARLTSLSFPIFQSSLKLMSIASVMPSNHLILCHPLLLLPSVFPSIRVFSKESVLFTSGGQSSGASASASVLPMNIQDWSPLGWTGLISVHSKGVSRVFSSTTVPKPWGELKNGISFERVALYQSERQTG